MLDSLVKQWRVIVKQRQELDKLSKALRQGPEAEIKARILLYLDSHGMLGSKTSAGTVTRTDATHIELMDIEKFLNYQREQFNKAAEAGIPLADVLLLQRSPAKTMIGGMVANVLDINPGNKLTDAEYNAVTESIGIRRVSEPDLSFKSAR